jgi:hypothetical protein
MRISSATEFLNIPRYRYSGIEIFIEVTLPLVTIDDRVNGKLRWRFEPPVRKIWGFENRVASRRMLAEAIQASSI